MYQQKHYSDDNTNYATYEHQRSYEQEDEEAIYDEPSDMNYRESDFHNTFSNSDEKFNPDYERGLEDGTLHGNSAFNTNSGLAAVKVKILHLSGYLRCVTFFVN